MKQEPLCPHCRHVSICSRYKYQNQEVWYCEEFSDIRQPQSATAEVTAANPSSLNASAAQSETNSLRGLCKICQNRNMCTMKSFEGGIWHCDNFS